MSTLVTRVAIVGTGVIGASWTTAFLARGMDVVASDPAPGAEDALRRTVDTQWPVMAQIGLSSGASKDRLRFTASPEDAVADVGFVQENGPEHLDVKRELFRRLDQAAAPDIPLATSASTITISQFQDACISHPERIVLGHPFNPPHLIPLVEVGGGKQTSPDAIDRALNFYRAMGKHPIHLYREIMGHVANRLQAALAREVYHLVAEGVVSVADVDTALCWGPGLRWGIMGQVMLNHLGGGEGGIEHFFQQFTGPMTAWWKVLGSPQLTPEVQKMLIDGVHAEIGSRRIDDLAAERDEVLLGLLELRAKAQSAQSVPTPGAATRTG